MIPRSRGRAAAFCSAALFALAGCKTPIVAELYTSDLSRAAAGEPVEAAVIIGVEVPRDECEAMSATILDVARAHFSTLEFFDCTQIGFAHYGRFRAMVPILIFEGAAPVPDGAIAVAATSRDGAVHFGLVANHEAIRSIWDALPEDMTEFRRFAFEPEVGSVVHNDSGAPVIVQVRGVFVDDTPAPNTSEVTLQHRDETTITASDVANAAFAGRIHTLTIGSFRPEGNDG